METYRSRRVLPISVVSTSSFAVWDRVKWTGPTLERKESKEKKEEDHGRGKTEEEGEGKGGGELR